MIVSGQEPVESITLIDMDIPPARESIGETVELKAVSLAVEVETLMVMTSWYEPAGSFVVPAIFRHPDSLALNSFARLLGFPDILVDQHRPHGRLSRLLIWIL